MATFMEFMATLHPEIQRGGLIGISQSRASGTSIAVARPGMPQEVPFDQGAESAFGCVIIGCFQFKDPTKNGGLCNPQGERERERTSMGFDVVVVIRALPF